MFFNFFGDYEAAVRPDPIPNSAVKRSIADGSGCIASARVGCRQIFPIMPEQLLRHFFCAFVAGLANQRKFLGQVEREILLSAKLGIVPIWSAFPRDDSSGRKQNLKNLPKLKGV